MIALDRPMPESCEDCPCFHDAACYVEGWRKSIGLGWLERKEKREEWCPLIDLSQYEDDLKESTIGQRNGGMPITETAAMMEG